MDNKFTVSVGASQSSEQKPISKPNARADLFLTKDGKIEVMDVDNPEPFDLIGAIRDLQKRVEELENKKS